VDYFTGWVEASLLQKKESSDIIRFLVNVFSRHDIPELVLIDNEVINFTANFGIPGSVQCLCVSSDYLSS